MEFSAAGTHMIMQQGYDPSSSGDHQQLFGFHHPAANPNPNHPNTDHWHVSLSLTNPMMSNTSHQEQMFFQQQQQQQLFQLKRCKYLIPAQELLNEFCNLGGTGSSSDGARLKKKEQQWEDQGGAAASSLYSMDLLELQKRKAKLLSMLEEVIIYHI